MTISDAIIIYLACGTPFGVHYFLKNRNSDYFTWLKALLVTSFWIPFALIQLHVYVTARLNLQKSKSVRVGTSAMGVDIDFMKKGFESYLPDDYSANSLFSFREVVETYTGLSQALIASTKNQTDIKETEILRISGHSNPTLGSACLARRNQSRLVSHQRDSREMFVDELNQIFCSNVNKAEFSDHSLKFVKLLCDDEAYDLIANFEDPSPQDDARTPVILEESIKWDLVQQKRSTQMTASQNSKASPTVIHTLRKN